MTTKPKPAVPATQDGATIVLETRKQEGAATRGNGARETVELAAVDAHAAPDASPLVPAEEPGATRPQFVAASVPAHAEHAPVVSDPATTRELPVVDLGSGDEDAIPDEVDPEWSMADQPTIQLTPSKPKAQRPAFLETGEQDAIWPPRPTPPPAPSVRLTEPQEGSTWRPYHEPTPIPRPPSFTRQPTARPLASPSRPASPPRSPSPSGRAPAGRSAAAYSDPRMRRLMALRQQREAQGEGQRALGENPPVAQLVRQWWNDLLPGLHQALDHQHEARASGVYPIPAHEPSPLASLGDAFGRIAAVVRDLGERAQSAAMPAISRLHDRAEQAAQAIVDRFEGSPVRQQAPLLGPGRVAVFFRQGVTVGQAQRVLMSNQVRPMRLIPRRHGFLGMVQPGYEADIGEQLRQHPYVRDVVYLRYDENGAPQAVL